MTAVRLDPWHNIVEVGWGGQFWLLIGLGCSYRPLLQADYALYNFHNAEAFVFQETLSGTNFYEGDDLLVENFVQVIPWGDSFVTIGYKSLVNLSVAARLFPDLDTLESSMFFSPPYSHYSGGAWTVLNSGASLFRCGRDNFASDASGFYALDPSKQIGGADYSIGAGEAGSRSHKYVYDKLQPNPSLRLSVVVL